MSAEQAAALAAFGQLLRRYRRGRGLSQEELAGEARVGVRTVRELEGGRRVRPYRQTVAALADVLGLQDRQREEFVRLSRPGKLVPDVRQAGREALSDALAAYQDTLVDKPRCEPDPELEALHRDVLNGSSVAMSRRAAGREVPVPRQLPAAVAGFTGRETELAALDGLLDTALAGAPLTMLITAIAGTAGVGKTALAVLWAHRVSGRFPDGQLYVNLGGYDPGPPVSAGDALAGFLRALGVAGQEIPVEDGERASWYRTLLAGRRVLVVLDNARDADQVRPLLPGTCGCATLVTSRDALVGLVARDGARRLDLDLLPLSDAVRLLGVLIGGRVDAEPAAAAALAASCGRLPLALRVAAELAVARPCASLAELASELSDQRRGLILLDAGGDARAAVRTVFSWSFQHLEPAAGRAFRLLGEHPGSSFDLCAVAALADLSVAHAGQVVDTLQRAHLVQPAGPDRYSQHDLLRAYARGLAATHDSPAEQMAARERLIDYYLQAAGAAMDVLFPAERDSRPRLRQSVPALPVSSGDSAAARGWLDSERANLTAVAELATWRQAGDLAATLHRYLDKGGHYAEAAIIHGWARRAASDAGDTAGEATALVNLATVDGHQGRYELSVAQLQQAESLFADAGEVNGRARALGNLGAIEYYLGRYALADSHLRQALVLHEQAGDVVSQARMLSNLGTFNVRYGRYEQARRYFRRALTICDQVGNLTGKAHILDGLGEAAVRSGQHVHAARYLHQALELASRAGDRAEQARVLCDLGLNELKQGRPTLALPFLEQGLELAREIGEQSVVLQAHTTIGEVMLATGNHRAALRTYSATLELASQLREPHAQASAHRGLGNACHAAGDLVQARDHWRHALTLYSRLGVPEADQVRNQLVAAAAGERS